MADCCSVGAWKCKNTPHSPENVSACVCRSVLCVCTTAARRTFWCSPLGSLSRYYLGRCCDRCERGFYFTFSGTLVPNSLSRYSTTSYYRTIYIDRNSSLWCAVAVTGGHLKDNT